MLPHRAVIADSWYGNIMNFRRGLDERKKKYVFGIHSDTLVFLESPVFEQIDFHEKKPGRHRKYPKLSDTNSPPIKVDDLGKCVEEKDWEHLEIRRDCKDKPLVIEAISRRVFPAEGYRKGNIHEETPGMSCSIFRTLARATKRAEASFLFARCPASDSTLSDENVDLGKFIYLSE
ncbi:MAG: transposase [Syntrophus sp. (in: bacteria)]